jgi:hypothetical protein
MIHREGLLNVNGSLNNYVNIERYVGLRDFSTTPPPEYVPAEIEAAFKEGASVVRRK